MVMGEATADDAGVAGGGRSTRKIKEEEGKQNLPIGNTGDGALLELHHVAGQGPRLVREDIFHLYGKIKPESLSSWARFYS